MTALKENNLVPASRNEVVDSLTMHIMVHTRRPSSSELEKVAQKLVCAFPNSADKVPGGSSCVRSPSLFQLIELFLGILEIKITK